MGRSPCCDKVGLKKGPWTPEEDQKLLAYIEEYGHGSWRALPTKAGLQRCGKSCRLRWTNYLRPDIKRGKFTLEEEQTIIQLHALLGNRWSSIATHLPKRTDNEIKNYWNTHLKKRLTKMGIDPVSHKPKNDTLLFSDGQSKSVATLSHMAQWESARLEAEARLAKQSRLRWTSRNEKQMLRSVESSSGAWNRVWGNKDNGLGGNRDLECDDGTIGVKCNDEWECKDNNNNNNNEHMPHGNFNFLESFTELLLGSSSISNETNVALEPNRVNNSYYDDNNKNYWNSILNLVNSSLQDPPLDLELRTSYL